MNEISDIGSVRTVVQQMLQRQILDVVLSPGSRNAPFILSFNAVEDFSTQSVLDERSAGFVALGIAQQKKKPVALSCTSGSAVANYAPALSEAYYQRIPLIAITADRPTAWIDQGEGQSIRQVGLLDNVVIASFNLVSEQSEEDQWYNHRLVNEALETALQEQRPVHINVPLTEPLYGVSPIEFSSSTSFKKIKTTSLPVVQEMDELKSVWGRAERIMILATDGAGGEGFGKSLEVLADDPRIAIVTETNANLYRMGNISCIDRTIEAFIGSKEEKEYIPDLLITIGGNVISKKLKAMFRRHKTSIREHWHLGKEVMDTFQSLTRVIDMAPADLFRSFSPTSEAVADGFGVRWKARFFETEQKHQQYLQDCPYSDLKVMELILELVPEGAVLQMGNSSVVRYIQLFNQIRDVHYYGNRGVSGIEGCTSTAVGAAQATDRPVLLISGDQAFRYDSNALNVKDDVDNLRIIVINNGGGNIFRIIDGPTRHEVNEGFIEKKDESSIEGLVKYHGAVYLQANDLESLDQGLEALWSADLRGPAVLEVFTPRVESPEVLKDYFKSLR